MNPFKFFDKIEDKTRYALSRRPVLYTLIGGIAIVLFWRGVWLTADQFPFLTGPVSLVISVVVLLAIGLFVSFFIGDQILISGLKQEKKLTEKTEAEVKAEEVILQDIRKELQKISQRLEEINKKIMR